MVKIYGSKEVTKDITFSNGKSLNAELDKKANKITTVVEDNLLSMDANGDLKDSGKKVTDFANVSHTHTKSDITDFSHTHTKSDITDFAHTHNWSDVSKVGSKLSDLDDVPSYANDRILAIDNNGNLIWDVKDTSSVDAISQSIKESINTFINITTDYINNSINFFRDATTLDTGKDGSIVSYTCIYDSNEKAFFSYISDDISGDTLYNPDSFSNTNNAFDNDLTTYSEKIVTDSFKSDVTFGKTFTNRYVKYVHVKASLSADAGGPPNSYKRIYLQTYDGSNWNTETTLVSCDSCGVVNYEGIYVLEKNVQGIRLYFSSNSDSSTSHYSRVYNLRYGETFDTTKYIETDDIIQGNKNIQQLLATTLTNNDESMDNVRLDVSTDSGTTWEQTTLDTIYTLSNQGTKVKLRIYFPIDYVKYYGYGIKVWR